MNLLPINATLLERRLALVGAAALALDVPLRELWNAQTCPEPLLPWLAWALSVDYWDTYWPEDTKRRVIDSAFFVHSHKGTIGSLRRAIEPLCTLIKTTEWWQVNGMPGTFRLDVGVYDTGFAPGAWAELEYLIDKTKPVTRHLTELSVQARVNGAMFVGAGAYLGDTVTIGPPQ